MLRPPVNSGGNEGGNGGRNGLRHAPSLPGQTDGLYWPSGPDGQLSPLGPLAVQAQEEGHTMGTNRQRTAREAFHGHYFKIPARQGRHAPGGEYNYVTNGNMIGGFAPVPWLAQYGGSAA